jgi:hypothetical protein
MKKDINYYFDSVIPRGLKDQPNIFVTSSDYLSRIATLNSKYWGVKYRKEQWDQLYEKKLLSFKKEVGAFQKKNEGLKKGMELTSSLVFRDTTIENEFEMFIYSVSCALSTLSCFVASFLNGKTKIHSHSKLAKTMVDNGDTLKLSELILDNINDWVYDLKFRRDAATHHIALLLKSKIEQKQKDNKVIAKDNVFLGIPKILKKYNIICEQNIPVLGGSISKSKSVTINFKEEITNEILDRNNNVIFKSNFKPELDIEYIDSFEYINSIDTKLEEYIINILKILKIKIV